MSDSQLTQPYEQTDFSGGFTDNYFSNDPRKCARNDNLWVDNNKKLIQRPGSMLYAVTADLIPNAVNGEGRIGRLFKFINESYLFAQHLEQIYYLSPTSAVWQSPSAPYGFAATGITTDTRYSTSEWQGHILVTNDSGQAPYKIFVDSTGTVQCRTAGLPIPPSGDNFVVATATASLITLGNDIRTQLLHHLNNDNPPYNAGLPHVVADTADAGLVTAAATDLTSLITLTNSLIAAYALHLKDMVQGYKYHLPLLTDSATYGAYNPSIATLLGMTLSSTVVVTDIYGVATLLNDLRKCFNTHEGASIPHGGAAACGLAPVLTTFVYGVNKGAVASLSWQPFYDWYTRFRTQYNAHLASGGSVGTAHSTLVDGANTVGALTSTPDGFASAFSTLRKKYEAHEFDAAKAAAWTYHVDQEATSHQLSIVSSFISTGADDILQGISAGNMVEMVPILNDLASKFQKHSSDLTAHYTNNPSPFANPYFAPGASYALASYAYAIVYSYTYTVGNVTFEDVSAPYFFAADPQLSVDVAPLSITNIPIIVNGGSNYDTASLSIKIYRTTDGGTVYFYVGQVINGVTTYSDSLSDKELGSRPQLYMTGGVVANDEPPIAKCCHIVNSTGYYGNIVDAGQTLKNRIRQSIVGDFDSCPGSFFDDLDGDEVVGISSARTIPIVFGTSGVYRIEGAFDSQGNGGMTHVAILNPDGIGCLSENSIVRIDTGVFFAGTDGFYFTDGYQIQRVSSDWNATYLAITSTPLRASRITGTYDKLTKRVHWAAQLSDLSSDNDTIFTLDLNHGWPGNTCWSTASNGSHFSPTSLILFGGRLLRGDSRGYLFQHHPDYTEDAYVNVNVATANWGTKTIITDYKSCATDCGMGPIRKLGLMVSFNLKNESNLSSQVISINDDNPAKAQNLSPIKSRTHLTWGDPYACNWGIPNILWGFTGNLVLKRRFAAKGLRFTYKQVELSNLYCLLKVSGTTPGTATVDDGTQTATLDVATNKWPPDLEGHFIQFSGDSFEDSFEILARVSDTVLTLDHSPEVLLNGSQSWEIWGYPKYEKFHLLSYALHAMPLSTSQLATKTDVVGGVD